MKKLTLLIISIFLISSVFAQKYSEIKGKVTKDKLNLINLYKVEDGSLVKIAETEVSPEGYYGFLFDHPQSALYVIGDEKKNQFRFYIKPGDAVNFNIHEDRYELVGKNTKENKILYDWESTVAQLKDYALDLELENVYFHFKVFFPYLEEFLPTAENFKSKIKSSNKHFEELMKRTVDNDVDYYAIKFLTSIKADSTLDSGRPGVVLGSMPQKDDYTEFYLKLARDNDFPNPDILQQPYGVDFLNLYSDMVLNTRDEVLTIDNKITTVNDDPLKAEILLLHTHSFKEYSQYENMMEKYGHLFNTDVHTRKLNAVIEKLYVATTGKPAADFTYPDKDGNMVSLSDFKGKLVYIDVWATWCGPCVKEIPYLKEIEEHFHGRDIVFMSVSMDELKNHKKWLKMIEDENLGGVQLFANGFSKIAKDYKINAIPTFILIDKNGNLISADALRPSHPGLKNLIENELSK